MAKDALANWLEQVAEANKKTLQNLGKNIIGVMFHLVIPSMTESQYSNGEQFAAYHLAKTGSAKYNAFQELGESLSKLEH